MIDWKYLINPLTKLVKKQHSNISELEFSEHLGNEANGQALSTVLATYNDGDKLFLCKHFQQFVYHQFEK